MGSNTTEGCKIKNLWVFSLDDYLYPFLVLYPVSEKRLIWLLFLQYEGDNENVDVDGLDEEMVDVDID